MPVGYFKNTPGSGAEAAIYEPGILSLGSLSSKLARRGAKPVVGRVAPLAGKIETVQWDQQEPAAL